MINGDEKGSKEKKITPLHVAFIVFSVTIVTLFFVWTRLQNIRLTRDLKKLKSAEQEAALENSRLQFQWAELTSPKQLEAIGTKKYNLNRPKPKQIIKLAEP